MWFFNTIVILVSELNTLLSYLSADGGKSLRILAELFVGDRAALCDEVKVGRLFKKIPHERRMTRQDADRIPQEFGRKAKFYQSIWLN